jgi:hypothetical protein
MPIRFTDAYWRNIERGLMGDGQLNPIDPRNINHPCHDEQWDELARAIGRAIGRAQYERDHGRLTNAVENIEPENRSPLRSIFE